MLDVVIFLDRSHLSFTRYGLVNTWTGNLLTKDNGEVRTYRSKRAAVRGANKLTKRLNKTINSLPKL